MYVMHVGTVKRSNRKVFCEYLHELSLRSIPDDFKSSQGRVQLPLGRWIRPNKYRSMGVPIGDNLSFQGHHVPPRISRFIQKITPAWNPSIDLAILYTYVDWGGQGLHRDTRGYGINFWSVSTDWRTMFVEDPNDQAAHFYDLEPFNVYRLSPDESEKKLAYGFLAGPERYTLTWWLSNQRCVPSFLQKYERPCEELPPSWD